MCRLLVYEEKGVNNRYIIKGSRCLLLKNGNDVFDSKFATRLDNALKLN